MLGKMVTKQAGEMIYNYLIRIRIQMYEQNFYHFWKAALNNLV